MKRKVLIITIALIVISLMIQFMGAKTSFAANKEKTTITLSDDKILVNGEEISSDTSKVIYKTINVEINSDAEEGVENTVIHITDGGVYTISGTATNTQIVVDAEDSDEVELILNNVDITCKTAPAILIYNALDNEKAGEAGVKITLEDGTLNKITGSHIPKNSTYTENGETKSYDKKYDAAISAGVSLVIEGNGSLLVDSDNEGIETKMHLTINGGNIQCDASDDAFNASEDNVSVVTINGGTIFANIKADAEEGDGIDSNGYIYVNGGNIYAFASYKSQDSGLDSDLGIYINGGTVIATGNMTDEVSEESKQKFIFLQFNNQIQAGTLVTITDENDNPIMAYKTDKSYTTFLYSSSDLNVDSYKVYTGGTINGEETNGLYTKINSYSKGTEANYTEANKSRGMMQGGPKEMVNRQQSNNTNTILIVLICEIIVLALVITIVVIMKKKRKNNNNNNNK